MLLHFGVTPYLVFDGDYLPSKAATEVERAARRAESKRVGLELHRLGRPSQAHKELQKAVDVTPEMAGQLIIELKKLGVQYVVAPYEADAQLAYLERKGLIQGILSEDSDLLVFGAKCLLTKLNQYGDCIEINRDDFTACRDISLVGWSDAEFRLMAILSGCDYLPSINNMGLLTAYRLVRKYKSIEKILRMLEFDGKYYVPSGYLEAFQRAELTFLCQRVFCPTVNDLSMVSDIGELKLDTESLAFIGALTKKEIATKVACGLLHPVTKKPLKIPGQATISPRTLLIGMSGRENVKFADMKENKSIESFFKSKRTPLAELDPNSFNLSPSQQQLQQRAGGTILSTSIPAAALLPQPSVVTPAPRPPVSCSLSNRQASVSAPLPIPKRRRLCSDADAQGSAEGSVTPLDGRSRFFGPTKPAPSELPLGTAKARRRKTATTDISIWSDDSIEDVMAGLPDAAIEAEVAVEPKKLPVFRDDEEIQTEAHPADPPRKTFIARDRIQEFVPASQNGDSAHDSQDSVSSRATKLSEMSVDTAATSISSSTQSSLPTMDEHVIAELTALRKQYTYVEKLKTASHLRNPDDHKVKPGEYPRALQASNKPQLVRHESLTPLQRLGVSALTRSQSWSGFTGAAPKHTTSLPSENTPEHRISGVVAPQSDTQSSMQASGSNNILAIGSKLPTIKGSEDLIVPDSEEEAGDALSCADIEEPRRPSINLGKFAFSG